MGKLDRRGAKRDDQAVRKWVGWTRSDWINELESAWVEAFILFGQARLAEKNRQLRHARTWAAQSERLLYRKMVDLFVHPVRRSFDRRRAVDTAVLEMKGTIEPLRRYVEREFRKIRPLRRGLDDADIATFWKRALEAAEVLFLED